MIRIEECIVESRNLTTMLIERFLSNVKERENYKVAYSPSI